MQPELALSYSSQGGNGLLGMGWSIQGLSVIHRCKATIEQDGFKGGINFNSNDRFCLDGQRLIAINGVYGADGTEYRTEIDTFTKIISHGTAGNGPAWFEVRYKSGRIFEYANSLDSQIEAEGKPDILVWAVNKVLDRSGNEMNFAYDENSVNGSYRIQRIDYGVGASIIFEPDLTGRPDVRTSYVGGSKASVLDRLVSIDVTSGTGSIRNYQISYENGDATGRSRITTIDECGLDGTCQPLFLGSLKEPTSPGWASRPEFEPPFLLGYDLVSDIGSRFVDLDGDGLVDLLWSRWVNGIVQKGAVTNTPSGWQPAPDFTPPYHIAADG